MSPDAMKRTIEQGRAYQKTQEVTYVNEIAHLPNGASYGNPIDVVTAVATCSVCLVRRMCIGIDTSEEEYGPGFICEPCALDAFAERA